jgi:hypothetical protein
VRERYKLKRLRKGDNMFEDIYEARPNLKKEIRDSIMEDVEDALKIHGGDDERVGQYFKEALEEDLDKIVETYLDYFNKDEMIALLNFVDSHLGRKYKKFSIEMMTPITQALIQRTVFRLIRDEDEQIADELEQEYFGKLDARLEEAENKMEESMEELDKDEWTT